MNMNRLMLIAVKHDNDTEIGIEFWHSRIDIKWLTYL
jgi:hypothetical protein